MATARDWLSTLFNASFKGAPFKVERDDEEGGRRIVEHQFPMRDVPYLEDLGEAVRHFEVRAYVASDGADTDAATIIAQCAARGPGTLVLPTHGPLLVRCLAFRRERDKDRHGYIALRLRFSREGAAGALATTGFLSNQVFIAADAAASAVAANFAANVILGRQPDFVATAAVEGLQDAASALDTVRTTQNVDPEVNAQQRDAIQFIFDHAEDLDADASQAEPLAGGVVAAARALGDGILPSLAISSFEELWRGSPTADDGAIYPTRNAKSEATNRAAAYQVLRVAAATAYCEAVARVVLTDRQSAITLRANVSAYFEAELNSMPARWIDLFHALAALRDSTVEYLSRAIIDLAPIVTIEANMSMPSLFWAWRIYQDANRSTELVARNRVPHPSFMPARFEALAR